MKTAEKIIIAGIVGTTVMTLYSYLKAKKEKQEYVEPVLINKLVDKSRNLPEVEDNDSHPLGWGLHYATGIAFMAAYYLLWKKVLKKPTLSRITITGVTSGIVGIAVWKLLFTQHDNPPHNYRYGYYKQLLIAHIVFSFAGIATYKALGHSQKSVS
ncbi:hypothetical protein [Flavobacterium psychrotrophum]|uniref:hypothetical protein n=1 Tax=Flavobacterium psychrotrophum TaxID=2294119 RepID=UPI000E31C859|nr:hypothetical protein [Flavobacterium psychrotrophum]